MKTFKLDDAGDLIFDGRDFIQIDNEDEVIQSLQTRLQIRLGEFFLDEYAGMSWENVFSKPFDEENCSSDIIECLSQDERVQSIDTISFSIDGRTLKVDAHITLLNNAEIDLGEVELVA